MICEKCKEKQATIHYAEIKNGKKRVINLCEECANKENGININMDFEMPFSMKDIFSSIMEMGVNKEISKAEAIVCSECNSSYNRFKDKGRLGCHKCYDEFQNQLIPLIKRIQGSTEHLGKVPKRVGGPLKIKSEIKRLRIELNKYVANEEFEKAATLRDKIKDLEKEL